MSISIDKALVWLALGSQSDRQGLWDALAGGNQLLVGAPQRVPDDNWRIWLRGIGGGGGIGATGPVGPTGPQGPTGPGFAEYQFVDEDGQTFNDDGGFPTVAATLPFTVATNGSTFHIQWSMEVLPTDANALIELQLDAGTIALGFAATPRPPVAFVGGLAIAGPLTGGGHTLNLFLSTTSLGDNVYARRRRIAVWRAL